MYGIRQYKQAAAAGKPGSMIDFPLEYLPLSWLTPAFCLWCVQQDGWLMRSLPEHLLTPEICLEAVRQDGWLLAHVPERLRNHYLCSVALGDEPAALEMLADHDVDDVLAIIWSRARAA